MSRGTGVFFSKREQALLRLASRRIRRLVGQLNEQERVHREMLIERDRLKSKIIRMEVEAASTQRLVHSGSESSAWKPGSGRGLAPIGARLAWLRLAPQRSRDSAEKDAA